MSLEDFGSSVSTNLISYVPYTLLVVKDEVASATCFLVPAIIWVERASTGCGKNGARSG